MKSEINSLTESAVVEVDGAWLPALKVSADGGNAELHVLNGKDFKKHVQKTGTFRKATPAGQSTENHIWI